MELRYRPRRLRTGETLRRMVRETRIDKSSLIYPLFVMDGENRKEEIESLPGQYRYTVDRMEEELGMKCKVVATGGLASGIVPCCRHEITYDDDLLLKGLWYLYEKNK